MKKTIIFLAIAILALQNGKAQITINSETVYTDNFGIAGTQHIGDLLPCTNYFLRYNLTISTNTINNIALQFPCGIVYNGNYSPTVITYASGAGTAQSLFTCSINAPATGIIIDIPISSPCYGGVTGYTIMNYNLSNNTNSPTSLKVDAPFLVASLANANACFISTGTIMDWVIKLENTGNEDITSAVLDLSGQAAYVDFLGYYQNNTLALLPIDYSVSSGFAGVTCNALSGTSILNITVPQLSTVFIHVSIRGKCSSSSVNGHGGDVIYSWGTDCSTVSVCQTGLSFPSNINFNVTGQPNLTVDASQSLNNGSYQVCSSSGATNLTFKYTNSGGPFSGADNPGWAKATNLKIYISAFNELGQINAGSFTVHNTLAGTTTSLSGTGVISGPFNFGTGTNAYTYYILDFSGWVVTAYNYLPGSSALHSLCDADGDGKMDDLYEGESFYISFDFNYNTSCPYPFTQTYRDNSGGIGKSLLISTYTYYQNQCENLIYHASGTTVYNYHVADIANIYTPTVPYPDAFYGYKDTEGPSALTGPSDAVAGQGFVFSFCPSFSQEWIGTNYVFDCLNGKDRIHINLPAGYHLDYSSSQLFSANSGNHTAEMELTAIAGIQTTLYDGGIGIGHKPKAVVTETPGVCIGDGINVPYAYTSGYIDIDFSLLPLGSSLNCVFIPLVYTCDCPVVVTPPVGSSPSAAFTDNFTCELQYICCNESCLDVIAKKSTHIVHHSCSTCATGTYFQTYNMTRGSNIPASLPQEQPYTFLRNTFGYYCPDPADPTSLYSYNSATIGGASLVGVSAGIPPLISLPLLDRVYPGDETEAKIEGSFNGVLNNFQSIYLQFRYNDLTTTLESQSANIFEMLSGSTVKVYDLTNGTLLTTLTTAPGQLTLTSGILSSLQEGQNINIPVSILQGLTTAGGFYFIADIHFALRTGPGISGTNEFFSHLPKAHHLIDFRADYMGVLSGSLLENHSCDDWGANLTVLQPTVTLEVENGLASFCEYQMDIKFRVVDALGINELNQADFPYEFRPYANINGDIEVQVPTGYTLSSAKYQYTQDNYHTLTTTLPSPPYALGASDNHFADGESHLVTLGIPITPTFIPGGFILSSSGLLGSLPKWPLIDGKYDPVSHLHPQELITLTFSVDCGNTVPSPTNFVVTAPGGYTENFQNPANYGISTTGPVTVVNSGGGILPSNPVTHYSPTITFAYPGLTTVNSMGIFHSSAFKICNSYVYPNGTSVFPNAVLFSPFINALLNYPELEVLYCDGPNAGTPIPGIAHIPQTPAGSGTFDINSLAGPSCRCFRLVSNFVTASSCLFPPEDYTLQLPVSLSYFCPGNAAECLAENTLMEFDFTPVAGSLYPSTVAEAGSNQSVCGTTATMAGNAPITNVETGLWTLISGTGTITDPNLETTGITGLGTGANVFQWTITHLPCPPSVSQVTITVDPVPTITNPILIQTICSGTLASLVPTSNVAGTIYAWTASLTTGTITGFSAAGTGNISETLTNPGNTSGSVTYVITPTGPGPTFCLGTPSDFVVTIDPQITPTFNAIANVCQNSAAPVLPLTSTNLPTITGTWAPAVSTATAGTTVYTFTPTAGECATTATLSITVNPQITPTFAAISNVCQFGTAPVLPLSSTNLPAITGTWAPAVNTAVAGTTVYTFTPTVGQCAISTPMDITVTPEQYIPEALSNPTTCNGNFTINGYDGAYTYQIIPILNDGSGNPAGVVTNISGGFIITWNNIAIAVGATVTVNIINGPCPQTITFVVLPCCNNGVGNLNFNNKSASWLINNGYAPGGQISSAFSINGTLTIDQNLIITGSDVVMGKDASIEINPGQTLIIVKSHLHAGDCKQMWYRIHLSGINSTTHLYITSTVIEDGKNAVVSDNGGQYDITGNVFNKNYIGMMIGTTALNMTNSHVYGNVFTCRDFAGYFDGTLGTANSIAILADYNFTTLVNTESCVGVTRPQSTLMAPFTGVRSNVGIEVNGVINLTPITIGQPTDSKMGHGNVFDYLDFGIRPFYSNVNVINNVFTNIYSLVGYPSGSLPPPIPTAGISAEGLPKSTTKPLAMNLLVGGMNKNVKNYFYNCQNGIYSHGYSNSILFNDFKNKTITSENPLNLNNNNVAFAKNFGVFLIEGTNRFNTVNSNLLEGQNWGINTIGMCTTYPPNSSCTINANIVKVNASYFYPANNYKSPFGIGVFQNLSTTSITAPVQVTNNSIQVCSLAVNNTADGIRVANSGKWKVFHNHIYYIDTQMHNQFPASSHGIWLQANLGGQVEENYVENGDPSSLPNINNNDAMGIANDNGNANVFNNWTVRQSSGIEVWGNCSNSQFTCNKLDHCINGVWFFGGTLTNIPSQTFTGRDQGNNWIAHYGAADIDGLANPSLWYGSPLSFTSTFSSGASLPITPIDPTNACAGAGQIFGNGAWVIKRENMLGKIVRGENLYDSTQTENMLSDSIFAYRTLQADSSWLNLGTVDDTTYQHFYYFCANENIGHFDAVSDALTKNDSTLDLNAVYLANENLIPRTTVDTNRQVFNRAYIDKLIYEKDTLNPPGVTYIYDSAEIYKLNKIAHQNPIMGGEAVYQARTALWIDVNDDKTVDHIKRLKQHGVHQEKPFVFKLYPNPNNGNMTLEYKLEEKEDGVFGIYSIQGKAIKKYTLNTNNTSINIDQSQLAAGAYFWGVKVNEKLVKMDKLIIIK